MKASSGISLWGMPGSGKSFWGRKLADKLKLEFFDLDELIELETQISIKDFILNQGEKAFRTLESEILYEFLETNEGNYVLALGGGTPCFHSNDKILLNRTMSVFIDQTPEGLILNLQSEIKSRPLFSNEIPLGDQLKSLYEARIPYYSLAHKKIKHPFDLDALINLIGS